MDENLKTRILWILVILNIIFILATFSLSARLSRKDASYQKQFSARIEAEEKMYQMSQKMANFEAVRKSLEDELAKEKDAHKLTKEELQGEQKKSADLEQELEKMTKLKETLEEDLKDALISGKKQQRGTVK